MSTIAKTIVATGCSSGLGFEAIKQLLQQTQTPYKFILGARDTARTQAAFASLPYDTSKHSLSILPLELSNLSNVKYFALKTLTKLGGGTQEGESKLDYLLLNAAVSKAAGTESPGPNGSKWCEALVVNHLAQHYLVHLLRDKLTASQSRIVFVSSGAIRNVRDNDPKTLEADLQAGSGASYFVVYCGSKFVQLLGAHYWRRQLQGVCRVVAVSPGMIPNTGLGRYSDMQLSMDMPDAKGVPEGARSILEATTRDDFPEDPEQIFLTSWGEWWPKDVYEMSLDESLQDKWCPSKDGLEKEEEVSA
ncbi:uncharacterized protein BCR38DRAFT_422959 [Pseudomassariella vexata]|uniref:Short-chain dehydrogenase/reductase n=1 Tax=Pseudomassariella vexata TaxID=1141098 RepID=A0A1Y2EAS6_9PEZI|nr:uncharacterized protein BCR38DRAFT_422959 [Pseudomassariella vexata]ORY68366.1 hypothetical protein BCR38DRAFT_422959 [Pseudomassariella vexata]